MDCDARPRVDALADRAHGRSNRLGLRSHRQGCDGGGDRHRHRPRARPGRRRQGRERARPVLRQPVPQRPLRRRLRARHAHGGHHRRTGPGLARRATGPESVRRRRSRRPAAEHEGGRGRRWGGRLAGHRRHQLGRRAPHRARHERACDLAGLRHRDDPVLAGGPPGSCGRGRAESRDRGGRLRRQRRAGHASSPHAGDRPSRHRRRRCRRPGHERRRRRRRRRLHHRRQPVAASRRGGPRAVVGVPPGAGFLRRRHGATGSRARRRRRTVLPRKRHLAGDRVRGGRGGPAAGPASRADPGAGQGHPRLDRPTAAAGPPRHGGRRDQPGPRDDGTDTPEDRRSWPRRAGPGPWRAPEAAGTSSIPCEGRR